MRIPFYDWFIEKQIQARIGSGQIDVRAIISDSTSQWQREGRPQSTEVDYTTLVNNYRGEIYSCASKNAQAVSSVPLRLYSNKPTSRMAKYTKYNSVKLSTRKDLCKKSNLYKYTKGANTEVTEILEHPFIDLMQNVNKWLNGYELVELLDLFLELTGNAYWAIIRDEKTGVPNQIWPLYSQWVKIIPDKNDFISGYAYGRKSDHQKTIYPPESIVHFKMPNPRDMWYGTGPLQATYLAAGLNEKYDEFNAHLLDNNLVLPFMLVTEKDLTKEVADRLLSEVNKKHRGHTKAGKAALFHSGLKPHNVSANPKDVDYSKGSDQTLKKIGRAFSIPWSMLSTDDVNLANAEAGRTQWMESGILPRLTRIEQKINEQLMPMYDETLFVAFDNPIPENKEFSLKQQTLNLNAGVITINEARTQQGLDEVAWGDEPPVNNEPVAEYVPPVKAVTKARKPGPRETAFQRAISKWLNESSVMISEKVTAESLASGAIVDQVEWSVIRANGEEALRKEVTTSLASGVAKGQRKLASSAVGFDIHNPATSQWAKDYVGQRVTIINESTRKAIREVVAEELRIGTSPQQLAREIRSVNGLGLDQPRVKALTNFADGLRAEGYTDAEIKQKSAKYRQKLFRQRSETIARTESAAAATHGEIESYKDAGVAKVKWDAAGDHCPECAAYDNQEFTIAEARGKLPLHPNCRCDWVPIID